MKLGVLFNGRLSFHLIFFDSIAPGSEAPSVLSAFEPGWKKGESSTFSLSVYCDSDALLGEPLGLRGRGNEILKLRVIVHEVNSWTGLGEPRARSGALIVIDAS